MVSLAKDYRRVQDELLRYIGWTSGISATADALVRAARSYSVIQERWCNEEMSDDTTARLEARETRLEERISSLVQDLPSHDSGAWAVRFDGDPRGYVVRIIAPNGDTIGIA